MSADWLGKPHIKLIDDSEGIAYVAEGQGPTLLLVHGSLCDYRYWEPQLRSLANRFHVVAPSLAHYHPRLPSAGHHPFSWYWHVQQLARFIQRSDFGRVHLLGHSRGAAVAWRLAVQHPELLSSVTLLDPGGPQGEATHFPPEVEALRTEAVRLIEVGQVDDGLRLFVDSVSRQGFWDRGGENFREMARDNAATLAPQLRDMLPRYWAEEARRCKLPVLLMDGERSPKMYRDNADFLQQSLPRVTRRTIAGASHGMSFTHVTRVNTAIVEFIASLG